MREINIKISGISIMIATIILTLGLTNTFVRASGRFNLPLSWVLTPSGTSVDVDNNGLIDNVNAAIPSGLIAMWSGSYNNIPSGWQLCDGTNGTPDLRDKFVYGVNTSYAPGNDGDLGTTGESTSHDHIYFCIPSHSHSATANWTNSAPHIMSSYRAASFDFRHVVGGCSAAWGLSDNCNSASLSVTIDSTGDPSPTTAASSHLPPYYKLAYIIKL